MHNLDNDKKNDGISWSTLLLVILLLIAVAYIFTLKATPSSVVTPDPLIQQTIMTSVADSTATETALRQWTEFKCEFGCSWHAPGCDIKGMVVNGYKIYDTPDEVFYDLLELNIEEGGRWFCTIEQAESSGWTNKIPATDGCPQGCTVHIPNCDILGNISFDTGEKIYHIPGDEFYDQTAIDPSYGERWFCTINEAEANGWRRTKAR